MPTRRRGTSRGQGLSDAKIAAARAGSSTPGADPILGGFRTGGTVKKTGTYRLHKGEKVIPAKKPRGRR
jgi:hypothetical protein